ncbi:MAG: glycine cleavage system protein GcvH [Armatimonadetes bacterium]|nr:MAG: glycine cleavage system protein GcvH [Armatimonadota bacterium]
MNVPEELKYTKTHEWIRIEGETATIGITEYAQSELGDIVYVDLPEPGRAVQAGQTFGSIESVKTVSDLYAPADGEIVEVNEALQGQPELVNTDPYGQGWLVKISLASEPADLLDAAAYAETIQG